jgi:hypothetical protein
MEPMVFQSVSGLLSISVASHDFLFSCRYNGEGFRARQWKLAEHILKQRKLDSPFWMPQ